MPTDHSDEAKPINIDLTNADEMRERFKDLSISNLCNLLREGLNELYCKLRDESFSYDMIISGKLDDSWSDVYITSVPSMSCGETRYEQMIKL